MMNELKILLPIVPHAVTHHALEYVQTLVTRFLA